MPPSPDIRALVEGLRAYSTLEELRASRFFSECRREIDAVLSTPLKGGPRGTGLARPRALRIAQWNIEKGTRFEAIGDALDSHPVLSTADVLTLNEVDCGMARSGNRDVARELGERRGMHWAFAPAHIELTKGVGSDLEAPGENAIGLQGNAILSRWPLEDVHIVALPKCFEPYHFFEKRYGGRVAVMARIETVHGSLEIVGTHLEVRNTPRCRAAQAGAIVDALLPRGPAILAGDLNVSTFARGTFVRTLAGTSRLLGDVDALRAALLDPAPCEPVFLELRRGGLRVDGWNTEAPTIVERIDGLEDAKHLPGPLRRAVLRRLDRLGRRLEMRLDWFAGRDVTPSRPMTIANVVGSDGERASDHDPIFVEVSM